MSAKKRRRALTRAGVREWLERRFFLRIHMSLILGGTFLAGLAATNALLFSGVETPAIRYGVSVVCAYLVFLLLIRLWLFYARSGGFDFTSDGLDVAEFAAEFVDVGGDSLPEGGSFGGAGASGSWDAPQAVVSGGGSKGGPSFGFDFDFDADELVVVILFLALVAALLFAGIWIIYSAPMILGEAMFEALLAGALVRRARTIDTPGWVGAVWRTTVWPFLAILVLAIAAGWVVREACPEAVKLRDAFTCGQARALDE